MESPFYEMTHDYHESNRTALSAYNRGYYDGYLEGFEKQQELIRGYKDILKELEPVEPEIKMDSLWSDRRDPGLIVYCGACKGEMLRKYDDYPTDYMKKQYQYCHHCGRMVLWK